MADDTKIPKQELLIKLLRLTESDNDGEALTALRKANAFMKSAGWDWEKLVNSKIRIIADPFSGLGTPTSGVGLNGARPTTAPPSTAYAPPRPATAPKPPPPTSKTTWPLGIDPNRFGGFCYRCGNEVHANAGVIFKPFTYHSAATNDWKVACLPCNGTKSQPGSTVYSYPAGKRRATTAKGKPKPFVSDLS